MRFFRTPRWFQLIWPQYQWNIRNSSKSIYLTFDDGPHPTITPWVLGELDKYNAKATFFVVGENAKNNPQTINHIIDNGHKVENHTFHHLKGWNTPISRYLENVELCDKHLPTRAIQYFRPPYGRITKQQGKELINRGHKIIMWSLLTYDYDKKLNLEKALKSIVSKTQPGDIVVFHDSEKAENQLKFLLPKYLESLSSKGYKVLSLP